MATTTVNSPAARNGLRLRAASFMQRQGVLIALAIVLIFGGLRYDNFLSWYNISSMLRYNSMFALIALGMTFVIMTGGIDLSVGSVAALASVVAALLSPNGMLVSIIVPVLGGLFLGLVNGLVITKLRILPFIVTLAMMLAARGLALIFGNNSSVSVSTTSDFKSFGQGDLLGLPVPTLVMALAYILGIIALNYLPFGRHVLAVGGNEEAARLMGLKVDRIMLLVYTISGGLAALAGVILAAQFGAGQPTEGAGWELSAIASVVVGGTLLTGGVCSVATSLAGALLLGVILTILNFENGHGQLSLSVYWQSVIRGAFLLVVVLIQSRLTRNRQS